MKTPVILGFAAAALLGLPPTPAAAQGGALNYYCHVTTYHPTGGKNGGGRFTTYLSGVFSGPKGKHMAIADAFQRHVEANYRDIGQVKESMCGWADDAATAQTLRKAKANNPQNQLVSVTWRYG